jgi:multicomponent K+:H+ antiporter subunit G
MTYLVGVLVLVGALLAFGGALGLVRLTTFYERVHPPTMATTLGVALVVAASILHFGLLESRLALHHVLISVFVALTTPITYLVLMPAALRRHRGDPAP